LFTAINAVGGPHLAVTKLKSVPGFFDLLPSDLFLPGLSGLLIFIVGWIFAGFSVIGQPHIMVRFMALEDLDKMRRAKIWYYGWFIAFYSAATGVGLISRILLPEVSTFDAELALPTMAQTLLHPWLVGLILAAIFAATMSTADSLVLTCSSVITSDIFKQKINSTFVVRSATVGIALGALSLALLNKESVFHLVVFSWSGLASAFAPLLIARCSRWVVHEKTALLAMLCGLIVALAWRIAGFHNTVYEGLPGILSGTLILGLSHLRAIRKE
jgi:Na+/proline symporter